MSVTAPKKKTSKQIDLYQLAEKITSNIGVGIYIVQRGKFVYISHIYINLTGYSDPDLLGKNSLESVHPEDREMVRKKAIKCLKGETSNSYEYRYIRKNGKIMWILEMLTSIKYKGERAALGSFMDITERKKMEETIRQSEEKYRTILEDMEDGYFETDLAGNFTFVNNAICMDMGYSEKELIGMNNRDYTDKESANKVFHSFNKLYRTGENIKELDYRIIKKNGNTMITELSASLIKDSEGKPLGFRGTARNVTQRKQMEETIRQSEERYRTIIEEMEEWYLETDLAGNLLFFNEPLARTLKYSQKELSGMNFRSFMRQEQAEEIFKAFHSIYETGNPIKNYPYKFIWPDGTIAYTELSVFPKLDKENKVFGFRAVGHEITERKKAEEQLNYMATHDPLTGLPNRMLLLDRLKMALAQTKRNDQKLAIMMLDLDNFKNVNDTLGHMLGDELLKEIGVRLTGRLRQNDTISRLGGDEFIILLPVIERAEDAVEVAKIVLESFEQPFICNRHTITTSISIGIAIYPDDCQDMDSLLKNADIAMYYVKAHGRNGYHLFAHINFNNTDQRIQ